MSLTVCTGWSPSGWEIYGRKFIETFDRFWHPSIDLLIYGERPLPIEEMLPVRYWRPDRELRKIEFLPLSAIPMCTKFLAKYEGNARANGREVLPTWKQSAKNAGYNWKFDAWKWSRQGFIPYAAYMKSASDYLLWLDGDVMTHAPVHEGMITALMPEGAAFSYLGRGDKHPDIAFQLYRRMTPVEDFLRMFMLEYASERVFTLKEWHSAWVWKHTLDQGFTDLAHDLTPGGEGHVWFQSPLQAWGDHLKGPRKAVGRSAERRA